MSCLFVLLNTLVLHPCNKNFFPQRSLNFHLTISLQRTLASIYFLYSLYHFYYYLFTKFISFLVYSNRQICDLTSQTDLSVSTGKCVPPLYLKMSSVAYAPTEQIWNINAQGFISEYNNTVFLTRLTELEALPACQLLIQDASQDGGQQQDRSADGWVMGGDQGVGHEG